jgi:hypothetical protein
MALTYAQAKEQFQGVGFHATTYKAASSVTSSSAAGLLLALTGIGEAGLGSDTNAPIGVFVAYESDGYISVQDAGYAVDVPMYADELTAAGDWVECNGAGVAAKSSTYKGVTCIAFDATNDLCILKIGSPSGSR